MSDRAREMIAADDALVDIEGLLRRAGRALGLHLCFHDGRGQTARLPSRWKQHGAPGCRRVKATHLAECVAFDMGEVHRALAGRPEGRVHTCPFGVTEMAVPVMIEGLFAGVLFAGACWRGRGRPPHPGMIVVRDRDWLEDRLLLLRGVAAQLAAALRGPGTRPAGDRRDAILGYLRDRIAAPVYLPDLAGHLALSPSRARHVVREVFGMTFSALVRSVKLREAAIRLRTTDLPVGEVARQVGVPDPNYFSRMFSREFRMGPRAYRRRSRAEP
ncbi:MAG: helix-turn-helix domain-containing protein [Planctomycetota bacterium]